MPRPDLPDRTAIVADQLTMAYGTRRALDGVTVAIEQGRVTTILGRNGAGKTTFLEACVGLRPVQQGALAVLGVDPTSSGLRSRVGTMLQDGGVYGSVRAREMLDHLSRLYATPWPIPALMDRVGLDPGSRTPFRRMSGGEQQRLRLACAIVGRPELVILDEPTASLDPHSRAGTWDLVAELRDGGTTVVLSTHLLDEAERLADDVVVIDSGRVVAADSLDGLLGTSEPEALVRLSGDPDLASLRALLPADAVVTVVQNAPAVQLRIRGVPGDLAARTVTAWAAGTPAALVDLRLNRRGLEQVFHELTASTSTGGDAT